MLEDKKIEIFKDYGNNLVNLLEKIFDSNDHNNLQKLSVIKEKINIEIISIIKDFNSREDYYKILNLIVLTLILLYKQEIIKREDFIPPENFILKFFELANSLIDENVIKKIFKSDVTYLHTEIYEKFVEQIKNIKTTILREVSFPAIQELNLLYWEGLDYVDKKEEKGIDLKEIPIEINIEKEIKFISIRGSYETFINELNKSLKIHKSKPDLVLIDTVLFPEYLEKGIFETIENYLRPDVQKIIEKEMDVKQKEMIGKTINGTIDAIPMTRNFHLPALNRKFKFDKLAKLLNYDKDNLKFNGGFQIEEIVNCKKQADLQFANHWEENKFSIKSNRFFSSPSLDVNGSNKWSPFISFIGENNPFIPMQAAKSAHTAYTAFAYFAGNGEDALDNSFLKVISGNENTYKVNIREKDRLKKPVGDFIRCIYYYVPFISLCCEHNIAAILRELQSEMWFDPCLPIEAERFESEKNNIEFALVPAKSNRNYLSCVGGYCLALVKNSKYKYDVTEAALKISKQYFLNSIKNNNSRKDVNNRIKYTCEDSCLYINGNNFYIEFEDFNNLAKRPAFPGWKIIEETISNIVRLFMTTILIYRSIIAELSYLNKLINNQKNKGELNEILSKYSDWSGINKEEILRNISNCGINVIEKYFIKNILNENQIIEYLEKVKRYLKNWFSEVKNERYNNKLLFLDSDLKKENWINANFDCILADNIYIDSLLKSAIKNSGTSNEISRHEEIFEFFTIKMIENLTGKLKGSCLSQGWGFTINGDK